MKKKILVICILATSLLFTGCGCSKKDKTIKNQEDEVVVEEVAEEGITEEYIRNSDEFKTVLSEEDIIKYKDVLLFKNENPPADYMEKIVLVGDSVSYGYKVFDKFDKARVWAEGSADTRAVMDKPFAVDAMGNNVTIAQALASVKPEYLYSMLGTNGVSWMDEAYFIDTYTTFINSCKEASPETKFIIVSIPPITTQRYNQGGFASNEKIDRYNMLLLELAKNTGCRFLYAAEVHKDTDGGLKPQYTSGDGIHWAFETYDVTLEYIHSHAMEE